ncbi:hypothetical protein TMatcc_002364 [Talaromyces marneffei ATCC 18224]
MLLLEEAKTSWFLFAEVWNGILWFQPCARYLSLRPRCHPRAIGSRHKSPSYRCSDYLGIIQII